MLLLPFLGYNNKKLGSCGTPMYVVRTAPRIQSLLFPPNKQTLIPLFRLQQQSPRIHQSLCGFCTSSRPGVFSTMEYNDTLGTDSTATAVAINTLDAPESEKPTAEVAVTIAGAGLEADGGSAEQPMKKRAKLSKRARKLEQRKERQLAKKAAVKEQKRLRRLQREKELAARVAAGEIVDNRTEEEIARVRAERQARNDRTKQQFIQAQKDLPRVSIDLEFEHLMTEQEITSMAQQVLFSYGRFRRVERPLPLHLHHLKGEVARRLEHHGLEQWKTQGLTYDSVPLKDCTSIPRSDLVYLTADSPNELVALDSSKTYVIGGIVDRNRHKGLTLAKAKELGLATARLPLGAYLEQFPVSPVLTVNHVYDILLEHAAHGDWQRACEIAIPSRKRAIGVVQSSAKESSESNNDSLTKRERRMARKAKLQQVLNEEAKEAALLTKNAKVALVTGASKGIGFAFATQLAVKYGWNVVMVARNAKVLDQSACRIRMAVWKSEEDGYNADEMVAKVLDTSDTTFGTPEELGQKTAVRRIRSQIVAVPCDSAGDADLTRLRSVIEARFGHLDLVVLSAGDFRWDSDDMFGQADAEPQNTFENIHDMDHAKKFVEPDTFDTTAKQRSLEHMVRANFSTKRAVLDNVYQILHNPPRFTTCSVVTVGSQAGTPNFVDDIEAKEGKGAAKDEMAYIASMRAVHDWATGSVTAKPKHVQHSKQGKIKGDLTNKPPAHPNDSSQQPENGNGFGGSLEFKSLLLEPGLVDTELSRREFSKFVTDWSGIQSPNQFVAEALSKVIK